MSLSDSTASFELTDGVLTVTGEIGLHEEVDFERAVKRLLKSEAPALVLDLSKLTYMNSSCVRIVAEAFGRAQKRGLEVTVRGTQRILRLFQMVGVDQLGKLELVDG